RPDTEMAVLIEATIHRFQKNVNVLKSSYDGPCDDLSARSGATLRGRGSRLRGTARVGPDRRRDGPAAGPGVRGDAGRRGRPDDVRGAGRRAGGQPGLGLRSGPVPVPGAVPAPGARAWHAARRLR